MSDHRHQYANAAQALQWGVQTDQCRYCENTRAAAPTRAPRTGARPPLSLMRDFSKSDAGYSDADEEPDRA